MSDLKISIPDSMWLDFGLAPKDGTIIYVKDSDGNVDIAQHEECGWKTELGCCSGYTKFAKMSI